jgi:hypothetical protein
VEIRQIVVEFVIRRVFYGNDTFFMCSVWIWENLKHLEVDE